MTQIYSLVQSIGWMNPSEASEEKHTMEPQVQTRPRLLRTTDQDAFGQPV